jgi:hypothetical protein
MDKDFLRDSVQPVLHQSMEIALNSLIPGEDGKLHLPKMQSPEYSTTGIDFPDNNYDLALIRWGCRTLIESSTILGIDDPLVTKCREALFKLITPPLDNDGTLMIAAGVPYAYSHRHYSHLLGIYPLHLYNWDNIAEHPMIEQSARKWFTKDNEGHLAGYSYTGYASMLAAMGKGDESVAILCRFIEGVPHRYILGANTMYFEAGGQAEVIETPLSAAQCVQELLLQSWGDTIRVFPAVPADWKDVSFHDFRAEGAFLVSAARKNGATQFVRIKSLMGEPCHIRVGKGEKMRVAGNTVSIQTSPQGEIKLDLKKDQEAVLVPMGTKEDSFIISRVPNTSGINPFGLK